MPPLDAFSPHLRIDTLTESRSSPGHQHRPAASRRRRPGQASTPPRRHRRPRHLQRPHTHLLGNADLCAVTTFRTTQWFLPFGRWYSKLDRSNRLRGSRCTRRTPRSSSLRVLPMPLDHPHPPERSTRLTVQRDRSFATSSSKTNAAYAPSRTGRCFTRDCHPASSAPPHGMEERLQRVAHRPLLRRVPRVRRIYVHRHQTNPEVIRPDLVLPFLA